MLSDEPMVTSPVPPPAEGYFLFWWTPQATQTAGATVNHRFAYRSSVTLHGPATVVGVRGKVKTWYPPGADELDIGLLGHGDDRGRKRMNILFTIDAGDIDAQSKSAIWEELRMSIDWGPTNGQAIEPDDIIHLYTAEAGGERLERGKAYPIPSEHGTPNSRSMILWYEPGWVGDLPLGVIPGAAITVTLGAHTTESRSVNRHAIHDSSVGVLILAVDYNRNGTIEFTREDRTSPEAPMHFWLNNDHDYEDNREDIMVTTKDSDDTVIRTIRDLEDFCPMNLAIGFPIERLKSGEISIGFEIDETPHGNRAIRVWRNVSVAGDTEYLKDSEVARNQTAQMTLSTRFAGIEWLPRSFWQTHEGPIARYIFEGVRPGPLRVKFMIRNMEGNHYYSTNPVHFRLVDVRNMYQRARIREDAKSVPHPWNATGPTLLNWTWDPWDWPYINDPNRTEQVLVYVHGWRLRYLDYMTWANTTYKRLWHQGFNGRFYGFRWPTFSADNNGWSPFVVDEVFESTELKPGGATFNASEYRAWLSGHGLADFVERLNVRGERAVIAHSMGNTVVGSALRRDSTIASWIMCNAAASAMMFEEGLNDVETRHRRSPNTDPDPFIVATYGLERAIKWPQNLRVANYALPQDVALQRWRENNQYFKPDFMQQYSYTRSDHPLLRPGYALSQRYDAGIDRPIVERSEAFAYVTKSRAIAVGARIETTGAITHCVNLENWFVSEHSAQWTRPIQQVYEFWQSVYEYIE